MLRKKLNERRECKVETPSAAKTILDQIEAEHEQQFSIAVGAALKRGFGRWFDDVWQDAKANGSLPRPFITSMFVFVTTVLTKKFVGGLPEMMPLEEKEVQISEAARLLKTYIDQIEAAAIKELYQPKREDERATPVAQRVDQPKGNSKLIVPKKKRIIQ